LIILIYLLSTTANHAIIGHCLSSSLIIVEEYHLDFYMKLFNLPVSGNSGVVWIPYHLLHHKSLKTSLKITGLYNGLRHVQYIFQYYSPNLDITKEDVIKQIDSFVELTAGISSDLKLNIRGYLRHWIFQFFEE
jgi:hypothetical protein